VTTTSLPGAPATAPDLRARLVPPLTAAAVAVSGTVALAAVDPGTTTLSLCPLLAVGVACPLCGGLRAVHALITGDLGSAVSYNVLVVALIPVLVLGWLAWLRQIRAGRPGGVVPTRWLWVGLVAALAFGVLRNVPPLVGYLTSWLG
jgi:hypothetical protein